MKSMISFVASMIGSEVQPPVQIGNPRGMELGTMDMSLEESREKLDLPKDAGAIEDDWETIDLTQREAALVQLKKDIAEFMGRNSGAFDRDGYAKILDKYKAAILPETSSTTPSPKCIGLASF
jgi:hypothetical protein